jgi:hypothetical protein
LVTPPVAFVCSLVGLARKQNKRAAVVGLVVSSLLLVLFFVLPILIRCLF